METTLSDRITVILRGAILVAASAALLTSCGLPDVEGTPTAQGQSPGSTEPVFSPCDDVPDDAIRAIGLDPSTESRDIMDVKQPGFNICGWHNKTHFLSIFATTHTVDDVRANDDYEDFAPVDIAGRPGFTYLTIADTDRTDCDVTLAVGDGAAMISISYSDVKRIPEPPCTTAVNTARALAPHIPA